MDAQFFSLRGGLHGSAIAMGHPEGQLCTRQGKLTHEESSQIKVPQLLRRERVAEPGMRKRLTPTAFPHTPDQSLKSSTEDPQVQRQVSLGLHEGTWQGNSTEAPAGSQWMAPSGGPPAVVPSLTSRCPTTRNLSHRMSQLQWTGVASGCPRDFCIFSTCHWFEIINDHLTNICQVIHLLQALW